MAATSLALKSTGTALTYGNATGEVRVEMDKLLTRIGEAGQDVRALADLFPSQGPQITTLVDSVLNQLMQGQQSLAEVKSQADEALGFLGTSHTEQLRSLLSDPMERLQAEEQAAKPQPTVLIRLKNALVSIFGTSAENTSPQTPAEQLTAELQRRLGQNVSPEIIKTAQDLLRKEIGALYEGPGTVATERVVRELVDREKRGIVVTCTNSLLEDVRRLIQGVVVHERRLPDDDGKLWGALQTTWRALRRKTYAAGCFGRGFGKASLQFRQVRILLLLFLALFEAEKMFCENA
jgi:hypothetical protein